MQLFYPLGLSSDNVGIHGLHDTTKNQSQSYIPITGCVLSHILSSLELSSLEKMYYLLADSLSCINSSKGRNRFVSLPAKSWASRLSCSKAEVFILQKSLEDKGYFIIYRDKNDKGQNNRNTITTTIPDHVFNDLKYEPDRFNLSFTDDIETQVTNHSRSDNLDSIDKTFIPTLEGKRQHLEKTKMFIRVPYKFLKELNSNCSISATAKVVLLYLYTKIYKSSVSKYNHNCSDNYDSSFIHNPFSIVISYQELQTELKLHRNSLTKVFKTLEESNLIKRDQIVIKSDGDYNSRADKSLWRISLLTQIPSSDITCQKQQFIKNNQLSDTDEDINLGSFVNKGCTKYDPPCTDSGQLYIKNFIVNNSIIRNIDYIDVKSKEEFLEDKPCLSSSEFYNNSSFLKDSYETSSKSAILKKNENMGVIKTKSTNKETLTKVVQQTQQKEQKEKLQNKPKEEWRELRYFYPLSDKDISLLNSRANREFSSNFVNQLLIKLYIKYPEKRFKNRFTFLSYMVQILANEKHQGPLVNHTSFRFGCNIGTEEKNVLEYEKYLSEIENSFDLSKEMHVRKKIAGRFSTEIAYKILTKVEFKLNPDNSFITALIPSSLALSERQTEILSQQLEAVYGINGYYVQEVEKEMLPKTAAFNIDAKGKYIGNLDSSNKSSAIPEEIIENIVWHQIRKGLREELGEHIDKAWFAKAEAKECKESKTLTLTMPTRFMIDWVRNNYSHVIRRFSSIVGIKIVEFEH